MTAKVKISKEVGNVKVEYSSTDGFVEITHLPISQMDDSESISVNYFDLKAAMEDIDKAIVIFTKVK